MCDTENRFMPRRLDLAQPRGRTVIISDGAGALWAGGDGVIPDN